MKMKNIELTEEMIEFALKSADKLLEEINL